MENCQKNSCHPQRLLVLLAVLLFEKFCGKYLEEAETEILGLKNLGFLLKYKRVKS